MSVASQQGWYAPYRTHIGGGWRMKISPRGYPVWWHRWLEAWWIVTGKWSLHRAWQAGKDRGHLDEMMRNGSLTQKERVK